MGLIIPTSNQFMNFISLNGVYFFDYFFLTLLLYYLITLSIKKNIFKENIFNIALFLFFFILYTLLAVSNSVDIDKYLLRDLRPVLLLGYAFILTSILNKPQISFKSLANVLLYVFVFKILFFILLLYTFSFDDQYYQNNIFRYFDAVTFIASLFLISCIFLKELMLNEISKIKLNLIISLALIIILISNLRILIFAIVFIYFFFSKRNLIKKILYALIPIVLFVIYSYAISANRVVDSNSDIVTLQIISRFAPAVEKIIEMEPHQFIYGLGFGTYFEIPWFEYRSLDTKLNTIDSTYLTLFVKYGMFCILLLILFFRLLLFNIRQTKIRRSILVFYFIIFITMSTLYQSGTIFHFLFLNLLFLSLNNENTSRSISINS
ncbi:MAG: DUF6369 family protein [Flavobacteriales bacterium]